MVVRSNMSPNRFEMVVPDSVWRARAVPIEEAGSAKEVAQRVREGKAFLKIVETPWGIEFYICDAEATS
jgi:hypothetical protein